MPPKTKVVEELESGNRQQLKKIHRFWSIPIKVLVLLVLPGISPLANFMLDTAKRKLERRQFSTSSSFVKI